MQGDCRAILPTLDAGSVHCCVTSPPYFGLRNYGVDGQIGLEPAPDAYIAELVAVFREVRRVLRDDGTLWLNLGDSYNAYNGGAGPSSKLSRGAQTTERPNLPTGYGLKVKAAKPKDLLMIPARVALALQADGWWLRSDIIWHKPNPMPESVTDRPTSAHEHIFLLSKRERYFYDQEAVAEDAECDRMRGPAEHPDRASTNGNGGLSRREPQPKRNLRNVWTIATQPFSEAHFATFPPELAERCIKAGCPKDGTVLDPFSGAGTTGLVAGRLQRNAVLIELNPQYAAMTSNRISKDAGMFNELMEG